MRVKRIELCFILWKKKLRHQKDSTRVPKGDIEAEVNTQPLARLERTGFLFQEVR